MWVPELSALLGLTKEIVRQEDMIISKIRLCVSVGFWGEGWRMCVPMCVSMSATAGAVCASRPHACALIDVILLLRSPFYRSGEIV
jgi:hypothetical protein